MSAESAQAQTQRIAQAFLDQHAPFDQLSSRLRDHVLAHCELCDYRAGVSILEPASGRVQYFYLIVSGRVDAERPGVGEAGIEHFELEDGENFPMAAMIGQRATRTVYRAGSDVRCLRLPRQAFEHLLSESPVFRDFCMRGVSSLLDQVQRDIQHHAASHLGGDLSLETPLADLIRDEPLTCSAQTTIRDAVQAMHTREVGSIVITDAKHKALGMFTLHDLRAVIAQGHGLDDCIATVMTPEPHTLDRQTYAFEAVVEMAQRHIRHVIITQPSGQVMGVISERDIFALQRINVVHLTRAITGARSVEALVQARANVGALIDTMMAHGAGVEQITRIITLLNDRTVARAIELCRETEGAPAQAFTWIAFGSEGRSEQTRVTDQDNGLLFDPGHESADAVRARLLPLARQINEVLDQCGFSLCQGNVMASNPALCLSFDEWEATFADLVGRATPEHILHSTIYFDFRPVWGDLAAGEALQQRVIDIARGNSVFLHTLAASSLTIKPPLGMFRDFVTDRDADGEHRLDLKVRGLSPFVDAMRVLALQAGIAPSNTLARLRALAQAGELSREDAGAYERSFGFIQLLRMREHQRQAAAGEPMHNRLDPDALNPMDRRILRAAFREARRLQKKLEVRFQL